MKWSNMMCAIGALGVAAAAAAPASAQVSIPADIEMMPIYDVRLQVHTCDKTNAQTSGRVYVRLYPADIIGPQEEPHEAYFDLPGTDLRRNTWATYGITVPDAVRVGDITRIHLVNTSNDGWCVDDITLVVNSSVLFTKQISGGVWLDSDDTSFYRINYYELRNHPYWNANPSLLNQGCRLPTQLPFSMFDAKLEGLVGDQLTDPNAALESLRWHSDGVTISRRNSTSFNVRMKLESPAGIDLGFTEIEDTATITATMHVSLSCGSNGLSFAPSSVSVDVDAPWYQDVFTFGLIDNAIEAGLEALADTLITGLTLETPFCPGINVTTSGVNLTWPTLFGTPFSSINGLMCPAE